MDFKKLGNSKVEVPVLGLGTWGMGGFSSRRLGGGDEGDVEALRLGLKLGMSFIDTAEVYASGHSEEIVARAVGDERESVFIATKVSAENLSYDGVLHACESSLRRLKTNYVDLYQVHWPNPRVPIRDTMRAMENLVAEGKVRNVGVSNFSAKQTRDAQQALSKIRLVSNQVEYSLVERSIEEDVLPYCAKEHVTVIAYSPVGHGNIASGGRDKRWRALDKIAEKYNKTRTQVALNWLIVKEQIIAIPKAGNLQHVKENAAAVGWTLSKEDQDELSETFS